MAQHQNELKTAVSIMLQELKNVMGRPNSCYGVTPVAIFRVIKPNN